MKNDYDIVGKASVDEQGKWDVAYTLTPAAEPEPPPKPADNVIVRWDEQHPLPHDVDATEQLFSAQSPQQYSDSLRGWRRARGFAVRAGIPHFVNQKTIGTQDDHCMATPLGEGLRDGELLPDHNYEIEFTHHFPKAPTNWVNTFQLWTKRDDGKKGELLGCFLKPDGSYANYNPGRPGEQVVTVPEAISYPADVAYAITIGPKQLKVRRMIMDWSETLIDISDQDIGTKNGLGTLGIGCYGRDNFECSVPRFSIRTVGD